MKISNLQIKKKIILNTKNNNFKMSIFLNKNKKHSQVFIEQIANNLALKLLDSSSNKKSFDRWVSLTIPAKTANLLPPVGPFLGQHGFNTLSFCNNFNAITKNFPEGLPLKIIIKLFSDKTLLFQIKTPPVSFLLYSTYHLNNNLPISTIELIKIALIKKIDLIDLSIPSLINIILGTARSMKLKIN